MMHGKWKKCHLEKITTAKNVSEKKNYQLEKKSTF